MRLPLLALALTMLLALGGCGQAGDLYIPDPPSAQAPAGPGAPAPAPAEEPANKKKDAR